jgi:hypothetical protein
MEKQEKDETRIAHWNGIQQLHNPTSKEHHPIGDGKGDVRTDGQTKGLIHMSETEQKTVTPSV